MATKKTKNKKVKAYILKFYLDKTGTLNLNEKSTGGLSFKYDALSMCLFGKNIAESKLLDKADKYAFAAFCDAYLRKYNE